MEREAQKCTFPKITIQTYSMYDIDTYRYRISQVAGHDVLGESGNGRRRDGIFKPKTFQKDPGYLIKHSGSYILVQENLHIGNN